jgi:hypothetical protein
MTNCTFALDVVDGEERLAGSEERVLGVREDMEAKALLAQACDEHEHYARAILHHAEAVLRVPLPVLAAGRRRAPPLPLSRASETDSERERERGRGREGEREREAEEM